MMKWPNVKKSSETQPEKGIYSDWKEQVAAECCHQCIYCAIHEGQFGGIDHYHIEHYRPKSIDRFAYLENDITNLYYSCPICNRFKSNDWPNDPVDLDTISYPDPSINDYNNLFNVDIISHKVEGKYISTAYMTERLYLNRPQLLSERKESMLKLRCDELTEYFKMNKGKLNNDQKDILIDHLSSLTDLLNKKSNIRPYLLKEIRK